MIRQERQRADDAEEMIRQERQRADVAERRAENEKTRADAGETRAVAEKTRADAAEALLKEEQTEKIGMQWTNLALRYQNSKYLATNRRVRPTLSLFHRRINASSEQQNSQYSSDRQINDCLPSWTQWNVSMPHDSWCYPYGRMVEMEGRLVVAGDGGNLHVLTDEGDKWDAFVRNKGDIMNVVRHQDVCLVCVKDCHQDQFVIEQFDLSEANKWRSLTVLPNELQLGGVSVDLHDNLLYVVGGETKSWKRVSMARVYDLHRDHWSKMDDMQTKRSGCSVVINNTVFVGGGETDGDQVSNTVECADVCVREWRTISSTTNYDSTLTTVSNRLVVTGGKTRQTFGSHSNVVELYDERSTEWLHLPQMTEKRWAHAALSTHNGELITAGGLDEHSNCLTSIESLKC